MQPDSEKTILIVEDERALSIAMAAAVQSCGGRPLKVPTIAQAEEALRTNSVAGIILDLGLPDGHGLSLLESRAGKNPIPTVVVTAHGEIDNAIAARKLGVREFFDKPIDFEAFKTAIQNLLREGASPGADTSATSTFIGAAKPMRPVFQKIAHACTGNEPVLIVGETGTGKTAVANLIAKNSVSEEGTILSWPDNRNHDFTISMSGGILLIDPLSALNHDDQDRLLSMWESNIDSFPRVIATASPGMIEKVEDGTLRSELFYRLQVLEISLPRLCERQGDIPALANYFLGLREPTEILTLSDEVYQCLTQYPWPGNLRELSNAMSYACAIRAGSPSIEVEHLPEAVQGEGSKLYDQRSFGLVNAIDSWLGETESLRSYREISGELEGILIERLLLRFDGKLAPMAKALGANRTTLRKKLNEMNRTV